MRPRVVTLQQCLLYRRVIKMTQTNDYQGCQPLKEKVSDQPELSYGWQKFSI